MLLDGLRPGSRVWPNASRLAARGFPRGPSGGPQPAEGVQASREVLGDSGRPVSGFPEQEPLPRGHSLVPLVCIEIDRREHEPAVGCQRVKPFGQSSDHLFEMRQWLSGVRKLKRRDSPFPLPREPVQGSVPGQTLADPTFVDTQQLRCSLHGEALLDESGQVGSSLGDRAFTIARLGVPVEPHGFQGFQFSF